jgi:hypothetical protein
VVIVEVEVLSVVESVVESVVLIVEGEVLSVVESVVESVMLIVEVEVLSVVESVVESVKLIVEVEVLSVVESMLPVDCVVESKDRNDKKKTINTFKHRAESIRSKRSMFTADVLIALIDLFEMIEIYCNLIPIKGIVF